jgi:hypothetical protein
METLGPAGDRWGEDDNARRYDAYAREYPNYREISRDLIAFALPPGEAGIAAATVADLACGTGATTGEIVAVLGPDGKVSGVDQPAAMLGVAATSISDPRASWIQARAESADQHVTGPGFLDEGDGHGPRDRYRSLLGEMRAIAARDYGWAASAAAPGRVRQRLTEESICRCLAAAGFDVEQVTEVSHQNSAGSQRAWLSVPIFTSDRLGGLPGQDRMRVLDKACERLGPGQTETAHWMVFAAHAGDPARRGHPEQPRLN